MLTAKENMREAIRGGNPDRFVNQFEGMDSSMENFEAIGGATISSNAMKRAIENAFQVYETVKGE